MVASSHIRADMPLQSRNQQFVRTYRVPLYPFVRVCVTNIVIHSGSCLDAAVMDKFGLFGEAPDRAKLPRARRYRGAPTSRGSVPVWPAQQAAVSLFKK
jgi:hypothetical protein